jgi:hypothetical protein
MVIALTEIVPVHAHRGFSVAYSLATVIFGGSYTRSGHLSHSRD